AKLHGASLHARDRRVYRRWWRREARELGRGEGWSFAPRHRVSATPCWRRPATTTAGVDARPHSRWSHATRVRPRSRSHRLELRLGSGTRRVCKRARRAREPRGWSRAKLSKRGLYLRRHRALAAPAGRPNSGAARRALRAGKLGDDRSQDDDLVAWRSARLSLPGESARPPARGRSRVPRR